MEVSLKNKMHLALMSGSCCQKLTCVCFVFDVWLSWTSVVFSPHIASYKTDLCDVLTSEQILSLCCSPWNLFACTPSLPHALFKLRVPVTMDGALMLWLRLRVRLLYGSWSLRPLQDAKATNCTCINEPLHVWLPPHVFNHTLTVCRCCVYE